MVWQVNTADQMIDRRRLRRKLTFWRAAAFIVAAVAVIGLGYAAMGNPLGGKSGDHIAKIRIEGAITEDEELLKRIAGAAESGAVKGVILSIDSPGGTTAGGEAIFEAVRRLADAKPVVAQVGTLAASAGYMIASATDHIVARQSSIVGSIGVIVQFPNFTGLLDKIGIKMEEIKTSPLKAEPSPFNPTTEAERSMIRAMILDSYDWFVGLVTERRPLSRSEVVALADGSVFTGRQGLERKLVDSLGGEKEAISWLNTKGVASDLKVVEWKPKPSSVGLLLSNAFIGWLAEAVGLPGKTADLARNMNGDSIFLDGLLSVWHPESAAISKQ